METTLAPRQADTSPVFSPYELLESVKIVAPTEFVTVVGQVVSLRNTTSINSNAKIYGEIQDFTSKDSISFCCPKAHGPQAVGQFVEIRGTINCRVNFARQGISVEINGRVLRQISPPESIEAEFPILVRDSPRVPLLQFVSEVTVLKLVLVGTDTAIEDAQKGLRQAGIASEVVTAIPTVSARMSYEEGILKGLDDAMKFNPAAIVFLRGGSDSTIGIWNQPTIIKMLLALTCPCYLALGHERFISAADQIVDQSFSTPTDFGNSLGKAMLDRAAEIAKNKHIEQLTMEIGDVRESVLSMETLNTKLTGDLQLASQEMVKLRSSLTLWKFAAIAVGASLALVVLLPQIKSYL